MIPASLDHLVYAAPDLEAGIRLVEDRLEVRMLPGGRHPAWRTANAILPLGTGVYLEVIGPDPAVRSADRTTLFGLDRLEAPRLVAWAAKGTNLPIVADQARAAGIDLGRPLAGSRARADGAELKWILTDPFADRLGGVLPFFIHWLGPDHPSTLGPAEVDLLRFSARHPNPALVEGQLEALSIDLHVEAGPRPLLEALFRTKTGLAQLS